MLTSPVAVPGSDPIREIGLMLSALGGSGGATVIFTCLLTPLAVTVIVAVVGCVTADVVTGIDIDHEPAGTVTVAGTLAAGESLVTLSKRPPVGAGPWRFAQTIAVLPLLTAA